MPVNLLADRNHYRTDYRELNTKEDILSLVREYLKSNVSADAAQLEKILGAIDEEENHEIRFDNSDEVIRKRGTEGQRVAYGAFRYTALEHSVQTMWTYTFEILNEKDEDNLYLSTNDWRWTQDRSLSNRVGTHLE